MNKKKLYESIMESISKELQNILQFNDSDIFNKEETQYNGPETIDNYTYKTILEKLKNAKQVSKEEYEYVHQSKYKVSSKEELKTIVDTYSKKNPTGSLNWIDTSQITDMSQLFECTKYNGDINEWNTSNVTNMKYMFWEAKKFNKPIGDWDVSNVTDMHSMFGYAYLFNQPIGNWDVSKVTDMSNMFNCARSFNQPIGNWNIIHVTIMYGMFYYATSFNQPIGNWDISNVSDMREMFWHAESFNQDISNWKLNYTNKMFHKCNINNKYKPTM